LGVVIETLNSVRGATVIGCAKRGVRKKGAAKREEGLLEMAGVRGEVQKEKARVYSGSKEHGGRGFDARP
jgi:hypothetical protein